MKDIPDLGPLQNATKFSRPPGLVYERDSSWIIVWTSLFALVLATSTYAISKWRFRHVRKQASTLSAEPHPPGVVPYWFPLLGHVVPMVWNAEPFVNGVIEKYGLENPFTLMASYLPLTFVCNPDHIQDIFRSHKSLPDNTSMAFFLGSVLGAKNSAVAYYRADNSGTGFKAFEHSTVEEKDRVYFHTVNTFRKFLAGKHLRDISQRFLDNLERNLAKLGAEDDWVAFPDLYDFLQEECGKAAVEATMGSKILELNPNLLRDVRARSRLHRSITKWHSYAREHSDFTRIRSKDPEWEPYFGSKLVRARQEYLSYMEPLDAHAGACEDMGLLYTINENSVTSAFWLIFHILNDQDLLDRVDNEIKESLTSPKDSGSDIDLDILLNKPLLQSCFAETLRLHVSSAALRINRFEDYHLSNFVIKKNQSVLIPTRPSAMNEERWSAWGNGLKKPLQEFDGERFLTEAPPKDGQKAGSKPNLTFSLDGTAGLWVPFGGGHHICPGRHFAKMEMLGTLAVLLGSYDLELGVRTVKEDLWYYPNGTLPPKTAVPFRLRSKRR
ncbi:unnamed protein product [Clonostachys rosea]|uniref:Cytochrome P450 n=1 Tax=Bionectria ochroleuca TaxID=29856 RepID=A0ABY6U0D6_BIOOC|nr:unnamed protein product [Clonostachys rosea]